MTQCPSDERLASLLDERLDGDELSAIEAHLEGCARCQQALEELTYERFSATEWRPTAGPGDDPAPPPPNLGDATGPSALDLDLQAEQDSRRSG